MVLLHTPQGRFMLVRAIARIRPGIRTFVHFPEGIGRSGVFRRRVGRSLESAVYQLHGQRSRDRMSRVSRTSVARSWTYTVVAYLGPSLSARLRSMVPKSVRLLLAVSWADVMALIRQYSVDTVFVDPEVEDVENHEPLLQLMNEFPSIPLVAYTKMTPASFSAVHILSKHGLHEVVLFGYDDTPERLKALFEDLPQRQLVPLVMQALHAEIRKLPSVLQRRVQEVFHSPKSYASVDTLMRGTSYSRSSLYNIFREVGLGSPGHLLIGARLIHALAYLEDPGHSLRQAAIKSGWQDTRILTKYLKRVWGMSQGRPPAGIPPEMLAQRLVQWMCGADATVEAG